MQAFIEKVQKASEVVFADDRQAPANFIHTDPSNIIGLPTKKITLGNLVFEVVDGSLVMRQERPDSQGYDSYTEIVSDGINGTITIHNTVLSTPTPLTPEEREYIDSVKHDTKNRTWWETIKSIWKR